MTHNEAEPVLDWSEVANQGVVHTFSKLGISRPNIKTALDWRSIKTWRISLSELQDFLNNQSDLPKFDFNADYDNLLALGQYTPSNVSNSAPLLADISEGNFFRIGSSQVTINSRVEDTIGIDGVHVTIPIEASVADIISNLSDRGSITSSQSSQITSLKNEFINILTNNLTVSPITVNKFSLEETPFHDGILQIAPNQGRHLTEFPCTAGEIAVDEFAANGDIGSLVMFNKNVLENGSREIDPFQINPTSTTQKDVRQYDTLKVSLSSSVSLQQLLCSNVLHPNTYQLIN